MGLLGLYTIGVIVLIFNITVFLLLCTAMAARLIFAPSRFQRSFIHPAEMFFFGSFLLSIATIIGGIQVYAIEGTYTSGPAWPWLVDCVHVLYWIYASVTIVNSILQYWVFMKRSPARPIPINPSWFLSGYSAMLTGTVASLIAQSQPPARRIPIIVSGIAYQGLGWIWSFFLIVLFLFRLMEAGLPPPDLIPGQFIPVGSPSYTIIVLIGLARAVPRDYGYFADHPSAADIVQTMALFISIFLWLFAFWLFSIAFLSCVINIRKMGFLLPWWAFIFPNVGFTIATINLGSELESQGILWVGSGMTICLVAIWLFTWAACIKAVWKKRILWPGKDEDKDM